MNILKGGLRFCGEHMGLTLIVAVLGGLLIPEVGVFLNSWVYLPALAVVSLVGGLQADYSQMGHYFKRPVAMGFWLVLRIFVIPILFFYLAGLFGNLMAVGTLLFVAVPVAVAIPSFAAMFQGQVSLSLIFLMINMLVAPFAVPFLIWLLTDISVEINLVSMGFTVFLGLVMPVFVAHFIQKYSPGLVKRTKDTYQGIVVLMIFLFAWAVIGGNRPLILEQWHFVLLATAFILVMMLILHLMGWFLPPQGLSISERLTLSLIFAYPNFGLSLALAALYFPQKIMLFAISAEFAFLIGLPLFRLFWQKFLLPKLA